VSFGLIWCAIALLPVSNIVPGGVMLAERTLLLPSVGFLLAVGGAAQLALRSAGTRTRSARRALMAAVLVLVALGIARSAGRQRVWNTAHLQIVAPSER